MLLRLSLITYYLPELNASWLSKRLYKLSIYSHLFYLAKNPDESLNLVIICILYLRSELTSLF